METIELEEKLPFDLSGGKYISKRLLEKETFV